MSSILSYAGDQIEVATPAQARAFIQRMATDLGGVRRDLATMAQDLIKLKGQVDSGGNSGVVPLSLTSALQGFLPNRAAIPAPTPATTPAPAKQPSVHRSAKPTILAASPDAAVALSPSSVDRTILLSVDFTGNFQGGSSLVSISFGAAYQAVPLVLPSQVGTPGGINLRVLSRSTSGFELTADNAAGILIGIEILVIPTVEDFD